MLENEDNLKFAIEDARARHEAGVALLYFNESQAMILLGVYATAAIAAASGFAAGIPETPLIPRPAAFALGAAALSLIMGAYFCLAAVKPAKLSLPGRDPDFWIWAIDHDQTMKVLTREYLQDLQTKAEANIAITSTGAKSLWFAKLLGAIAPAAAILVGAAAGLWHL